MYKEAVATMMDKVVVDDPRQPWKIKYPLLPTLFAIIIAWCCGCNSSTDVEDFWCDHLDWLRRTIPNLPDELISHDTVRRLLCIIKFEQLNEFLKEFCEYVAKGKSADDEPASPRILSMDGQAVNAMVYEPKIGDDGKFLYDRRTHNRLYYVSLHDSTNNLTLAQDEVKVKENENKACIRLLKLFDLTGTVVTADALNTQRAVAKAVIEQHGDYMLAVKDNHQELREHIEEAMNGELEEARVYSTEIECGHGRIERRTVKALPFELLKKCVPGTWKEDAESVFMAITGSYDKKYEQYRENEVRFFISSLVFDNDRIAELGYKAIREHWHIENCLHYVLDVSFNQDHMQMKSREYARNRVFLNKLALNVLRLLQDEYSKANEKISIKRLLKKMSYHPERVLEGLIKIYAA